MTNSALDLSHRDESVRLADDLFGHVNGRWLATEPIPDDKAVVGAFHTLRDDAEAAVRDIIEGAPDDGDAGKISALYSSFMDTTKVSERGTAPLTEIIQKVSKITNRRDFVRMMGELSVSCASGIFSLSVEADPGRPQRMVAFLSQAGLGLPDESYYREEQHEETREHYATYLKKAFTLAGLSDAESRAADVLSLETDIASHHWDRIRCRDLKQMYNLVTLKHFAADSPDLMIATFLEGAGIEESALDEFVCAQPSFFTGVQETFTDERLPAWISWMQARVIRSLAAYLPDEFVQTHFDFFGTILTGQPELRPRWKRGVSFVESVMGDAVGKLYVEQHFPPSSKSQMDALVDNLIEAYRRSIAGLDWMTDATKERALDKLSKFTPKVGYPAQWRDFSDLTVSADNLIDNVLEASRFEVNYMLSKIGKPVDKGEWLMTPQTVNAYYHPLRNEIVFPAAILQPPFFHPDADDAVNYGGIGAVIGHEIGHGFDDQGSTCDGDGALVNWWADDDRVGFESRAQKLIDQFNQLEPRDLPGHTVNGELTIGENIGDLGGLTIAYKAWLIALEKQNTIVADLEPIDGLTGPQRLFWSWATIWRGKSRDEIAKTRLVTDPHSPAEFRCNQIVSNIPDFYEAFDIVEGDRMWLAPEQRVAIW